MIWNAIFLALCIYLKTSSAQTEQDFIYTIAVVEYKPISDSSLSGQETVNENTLEYISLLREITKQSKLELVLFPESTLGGSISAASEVPLPFTDAICNSSDTTHKSYLKRFSCAAIEFETTIVVNIIEKENCAANNATGFCPSSGIIYYNSNVAFNTTGSVIGRYRKWNLFGEYKKSQPAEVELVSITTANNNTFGMFTCFDILFYEPALNLTRDLGITNILFPSMWFSELPYLTALQTQQMWAHEVDVNFMSSGANDPKVGSGGSGIFVGKEGPVGMEIIGGAGGTTVIAGAVSRLDIENNPYKVVYPLPEETDALAPDMDSFYLLTDPSIINYTSVLLDTSKTVTSEEVCNGDSIKICCQFNITLTVDDAINNEKGERYTYHLAAFNGVRSFSGVRDGGMESCGVLACLDDSLASCGKRFSNYSDIVWPITFENITISADFNNTESRIQFPNSVLASLRPVSPQYTIWNKEESADGDVVTRSFSLTVAQNRLLTFGIFGRDFSRDGELIRPENDSTGGNKCEGLNFSVILILLSAAVLYVRIIFKP